MSLTQRNRVKESALDRQAAIEGREEHAKIGFRSSCAFLLVLLGLVFESPVWSGFLLLQAKTGTRTGPDIFTLSKRPDCNW